MRFARLVFTCAAVYGLATLIPMYFAESLISERTPPALTHPEFFYGFVGVALAWQVLFVRLRGIRRGCFRQCCQRRFARLSPP